jgi:hypothetical protein
VLFHCKPVNQQKSTIFALILWEEQRLNRFWSEKRCRNSTFTLGSKKMSYLLLLTHTWWCENITASPCGYIHEAECLCALTFWPQGLYYCRGFTCRCPLQTVRFLDTYHRRPFLFSLFNVVCVSGLSILIAPSVFSDVYFMSVRYYSTI